MGSTLGNYELLSLAYHEPVGAVRLGRHRTLAKDVYILVVATDLARDDAFRLRFLREMRSVGRLHHPNILRILDVGEQGETLYVVMEKEDGDASSSVVRDRGRIAPLATCRIGVALCNALIHAHLKGIPHRNLHPGNVWFRLDGSPVVKGFGFSLPTGRPASAEVADEVDELPTFLYRAPELSEEKGADWRCDLWSLGALLFFFLSADHAFRAATPKERQRLIREGRLELPAAIQEETPASAVELLRRMLSWEPRARPASLYEVKAELAQLAVTLASTLVLRSPTDPMGVGARFDSAESSRSYEILQKRGDGAFGTVYKVREVRTNRVLALKVMKTKAAEGASTSVKRFERERQALRAVDHPNLAKIVDMGTKAGVLYLAMEFVEGPDLREVIRAAGRVPPSRAVSIALEIARGLQAAHEANIVHRDLSPSNVLLEDTGRVVLTDFGLAVLPGMSRLTATGDILGTPQYLAPETINARPADARTDLYSLGVLLYEMLSGKPPFVEETYGALFMKILEEEPPLYSDMPPDLPTSLKAVLLRLLEKKPENRYPDAGSLIQDLERVEDELERTRPD